MSNSEMLDAVQDLALNSLYQSGSEAKPRKAPKVDALQLAVHLADNEMIVNAEERMLKGERSLLEMHRSGYTIRGTGQKIEPCKESVRRCPVCSMYKDLSIRRYGQ